jgi:hypothetical protein
LPDDSKFSESALAIAAMRRHFDFRYRFPSAAQRFRQSAEPLESNAV